MDGPNHQEIGMSAIIKITYWFVLISLQDLLTRKFLIKLQINFKTNLTNIKLLHRKFILLSNKAKI
jgi:hypothetical protein